jgi:hypothetical protein
MSEHQIEEECVGTKETDEPPFEDNHPFIHSRHKTAIGTSFSQRMEYLINRGQDEQPAIAVKEHDTQLAPGCRLLSPRFDKYAERIATSHDEEENGISINRLKAE